MGKPCVMPIFFHQELNMTRKEFIAQVGIAGLALPVCFGMLSGCGANNNPFPAPTNVDFTVDVSTGSLATPGGYIVKSGVLVARTLSDTFIAVSAACTHEGTTVRYVSSRNDFECPSHGATFSSSGSVTGGPARSSLGSYNTTLSGTSLRVFS